MKKILAITLLCALGVALVASAQFETVSSFPSEDTEQSWKNTFASSTDQVNKKLLVTDPSLPVRYERTVKDGNKGTLSVGGDLKIDGDCIALNDSSGTQKFIKIVNNLLIVTSTSCLDN